MGRLKKISLLFLALVVVLAIFHVTSVSAQEDFIVTVGEDKVFTEFNYHTSWFDNDPNNPEPWPDEREAYSEGNVARVSLSATPGHAGQAHAWTGVQFEWDLGQYTWEEVKDWPVKVTIDFSYQIEAYWTEGNGSANAGVNLIGFTAPWYDLIGREAGQSGSHGNTVSETYTSTVEGLEALGRRIILQTYCQAHSAYREDEQGNPIGTTHNSSANATINSIKIEFGPKLFVVIPGVGFGNTPEHGAMMLWRAVNMFRDDYESLKEIRQVDNLSDEQVRQMIIEASQKAQEKGKDVIVNIDMDLDGFSVLTYINPFSERWLRSVIWAGRMANVVSDAFKEINPTGVRILYAHSAGVDATTQSIQQRPGERMYDDLNLLNGRTKATSLARSLGSSGYSWWQVKVFTSKRDLPAFPDSLSYYSGARRWAGSAWVHLHSLTITGHNGLRDSIKADGTEVSGNFKINGGKIEFTTVRELMLRDWKPYESRILKSTGRGPRGDIKIYPSPVPIRRG